MRSATSCTVLPFILMIYAGFQVSTVSRETTKLVFDELSKRERLRLG